MKTFSFSFMLVFCFVFRCCCCCCLLFFFYVLVFLLLDFILTNLLAPFNYKALFSKISPPLDSCSFFPSSVILLNFKGFHDVKPL